MPGRHYRRRNRWAALPRSGRVVLSVLPVIGLLGAGAAGLDRLVGHGDGLPSSFDSPLFARSEAVVEDRPTPGGATERLRPPVEAGGGGQHGFLAAEADGSPARWDPCRPIRLVVDETDAPRAAPTLFDDAVAELVAATGLAVEVEGTTDEPLDVGRPLVDRDRYGDRWAPVLVTWSDVERTPELEDALGFAGGFSVTVPGTDDDRRTYVSGIVVYDSEDLGRYLDEGGDDNRDLVREVLLHELGHLVGLDHVASEAEVMHAGPTGHAHYGPGDLEGLAGLGRGPCVPGL